VDEKKRLIEVFNNLKNLVLKKIPKLIIMKSEFEIYVKERHNGSIVTFNYGEKTSKDRINPNSSRLPVGEERKSELGDGLL